MGTYLKPSRTQTIALVFGAVALVAAGANPRSAPAPAATVMAATSTVAAATSTVAESSSAVAVATSAGSRAGLSAKAAMVEGALDALSGEVRRQSGSDALRLAFQAYFNYKTAHPDEVRNPYLYFVDYGLDNRTPRGYVFDMEQLTVVDGPFIVAHGRGSSKAKNAVPSRFSNIEGSATTSLGLYVTQETYGFSGHTAGKLYTSVGLRLQGVSGSFNDAARERRVVVHGAPYVTPTGAGRSEGCPAMEQARAKKLIPLIANGGLVFLYSPNEPEWAASDPWATAAL